MGQSIRRRILGPFAILIGMSLIAIIWVSLAALHFHKSTRDHNEQAFATLQLARNARQSFGVADDYVTHVIEFNVLEQPAAVQAKFAASMQKLNADFDALVADIGGGQFETSFGSLKDAIARWSSEASIALGLTSSRTVPTPRLLKKLSATITADISRVEGIAQTRASELEAGEGRQFAGQILYAFVIILLLFSAVAALALRQA
jgi:hypothetical protein